MAHPLPREPAPATRRCTARVDGRTLVWEAPVEDEIGGRITRTGRPYEYFDLQVVDTILDEGAHIIDVGANIGNHTVYWAVMHRASVVSFEPNRQARSLLARNVVLNGVQDRVTIRPEALGAVDGRGAMTDSAGNLGASRLRESEDGRVPIVTLDSLSVPSPDLVKIDVEGRELEVIRGAAELLAASRPPVWVEAWTPQRRRSLRSELERLGYDLPPMIMSPANALFLPDRRSLDAVTRSRRFAVRGVGEAIESRTGDRPRQ